VYIALTVMLIYCGNNTTVKKIITLHIYYLRIIHYFSLDSVKHTFHPQMLQVGVLGLNESYILCHVLIFCVICDLHGKIIEFSSSYAGRRLCVGPSWTKWTCL